MLRGMKVAHKDPVSQKLVKETSPPYHLWVWIQLGYPKEDLICRI
jgi:hypothetical protein